MPLSVTLADFRTAVAQCDALVADAHKADAAGAPLFSRTSQEQITTAAFLNAFVAWETFLESSLMKLMTGEPTMNGAIPTRFVAPPHVDSAQRILIGIMRFFDFGNHKNMRKIAQVYFDQGYPYEPHLGGIFADLESLRIMRNSAAHISSTTQIALESLAVRLLGMPQPGIGLYRLLMTVDPNSAGGETIFSTYKNKLLLAAELIAQG